MGGGGQLDGRRRRVGWEEEESWMVEGGGRRREDGGQCCDSGCLTAGRFAVVLITSDRDFVHTAHGQPRLVVLVIILEINIHF